MRLVLGMVCTALLAAALVIFLGDGGAVSPTSTPGTWTLEGRVFSPDGTPVALGHVGAVREVLTVPEWISIEASDRAFHLGRCREDEWRYGYVQIASGVIEDGRFQLEVPARIREVGIWIRDARDATDKALGARLYRHAGVVGREAGAQEIHLEEGAVIAGRVVDAQGVGIPGTEVVLTYTEGLPEWLGPPTACTTGTDGRFELRGLSDQAEVLTVRPPDGWAYVPQRVVEAGTGDLLVSLLRGVPLSGRVGDLDGAPVVGARVLLLPADRDPVQGALMWEQESMWRGSLEVRTGPDGRFAIPDVVPVAQHLYVRAPPDAEAWDVIPFGPMAVMPGGDEVLVEARRGVVLEVRVVDRLGRPVDECVVQASSGVEYLGGCGDMRVVRGLQLAESGTGRFVSALVEPGQYRVDVLPFEAPGGAALVARTIDTSDSPVTLTLDLAHEIRGRVYGPSRNKVLLHFRSAAVEIEGETDREGHFVLRFPEPAKGTILFRSDDQRHVAFLPDVSTERGPYVAALEPGLVLAGRVEGEGAAGAPIQLVGPHGFQDLQYASAPAGEGSFRFQRLLPGLYRLRAYRGGGGDDVREVVVEVAAGREDVVLRLPAGE